MGNILEQVQFTNSKEFPAKAENIAIAEKMIDEVCKENDVHESLYGNILIALTEAVNNAIHHGNRLDPHKSVKLSYEVREKDIVFLITDEGPGFDHENLPDPTDPENIEKPHGRGVFLMKALAEEVEFEDNGSSVVMTFSRTPMED